MSGRYCWVELFIPRGLDIDGVTGIVRPLASRPRIGWRGTTPRVVIEQWAHAGQVRYLLGVEAPLGATTLAMLVAAAPGLVSRPIKRRDLPRVMPVAAREIRLQSVAATLRTDLAEAVSAGVGHALMQAGDDHLVMQWVFGPAQRRHRPDDATVAQRLGFVAARTPTAYEQTAWRQKASEPLYAVTGRLGTTGNVSSLAALAAALRLSDSAHGHLLVTEANPRAAERLFHLSGRRSGGIVSAREAAMLLGWPLDGADGGRSLPVGDVPPTPVEGGRVLGTSRHPATLGVLVTWPAAALTRHQHVVGPTGSGKSNLLARHALDDVAAGRSLVVFEPKGDLCDAIMARLTPEQAERVIAIDAGETRHPVGSSPLLGAAETAERRADDVVNLFRDLHGTAIGPRSADVLLHALLLATRLPGGTLIDVVAILTNPLFRQQLAQQITDPLVLSPWLEWFDSLSDGERAQVVAPILNKLRGFTSRASIRRLLGQSDPGWTWDEALGDGSIVLVSLNRGVVGKDAATILGSLLMGQLWSAIQRRTRLPEAERPLASVIVDEFQLFMHGLDFEDVFATARGMGVSFAAAHQLLGQLSPSLRTALFANTRSKLTFKPSKDDAATLAALLESPNVTADDLLALQPFEAVATCYGVPGAFHVATPALSEPRQRAEDVRAASRRRHGKDGDEIDRALLAKWQDNHPSAPVGRTKRGARS